MGEKNVRLVATDVDGTFLRPDRTYDRERFGRLMERMGAAGCRFVAASGDQYHQLRRVFSPWSDRIAYVAENGGYVRDGDEVLHVSDIGPEALDRAFEVCAEIPEASCLLCGVEGAYMERGSVPQHVFDIIQSYYPRLSWVDDLRLVDDRILKFALGVPEELTAAYYERICGQLGGLLEATSSGHGAIDLIAPGCHKAFGLALLAERWGVAPEECVAFGDGGNDVEMLRYVGRGYAVANAPAEVRAAADLVCPSNADDGVLVALEQILG